MSNPFETAYLRVIRDYRQAHELSPFLAKRVHFNCPVCQEDVWLPAGYDHKAYDTCDQRCAIELERFCQEQNIDDINEAARIYLDHN